MANYLGNIDLKREKTPSIEQKIANIMGTTPSQVRALSDELTARRKTAEEAAKKAAQDQAARAKTEAALAAQRSAAAAKQSEAARVANAKAIKQRLSAGLKKPAQTSAVASAPATMVAIDTDILPAGTDTRSAIRSGKAYYDQLVEEGTQRADRSGVENALNGLEYETEKAKAQVETAAAAYNKTADYLKQQAAKIDELSAQIEVYSSNAEGMNAADRTAYNELVRQRDVAIDLYNRAAGQGQKWASTYETAAQNLSDASTAQGRVKYSNDAGAHLEGEITMAQGEYERVREYIRTNGAYIVQEYALRGEDGNAYMEDLLARSEQAVNDAKTAYAAWQSGKLAFEADIMEYDLPAADRMYFRRIAEYETYRGNFAKVGDSGYARAQEAAKRAEPILREKYGEKYSYYLQLTQYKINAEDREKQVNKIRSASGLEKGALSVLSVATNLLASPGVLYEYTVQSATRAADWMPIDTNAQGFSAQNLTQDIRGVTAQALENQYGKAASFVYSTAMSGLDSFVAGNTFGKAGGVVLGFSAGAAQMMDVTARGGSIEEAVASGIAAGVFEMLFETVSIGQMKAMQATAFQAGSLREMFSTKTLGTYVMNIGKEALVNFSEEAATEIANIMYDLTSLGDLSNIARQISTLMENEGLTEEQAKKIVAKTLGQQVLEAGLSGALMGAAFGAIDTSIAAYNQIENVKQLASARKLAATLPEAYRPSFDAANVTNETAAAYAVEVYLAAQRYNKAQQETQGAAKAQQEAESTAQAQQVMEEKAAVSVSTLASAQQIYNAQQEARAQAQAETGTGEAAQDAQDATVLSGYGNAENAVAGEAGNINGGETEADARARGEVMQLAQAFAGEELIQAVGDLANDRRMAGDAQGAAALEKALAGYQAGVYTGENEGGTADGREVYLRDGGEWNDGTDSGGAVRGVAENAGRDPGGNLQGNGGRPAGAGGDAPGNQSAYRTVQGSTRQVTGFRNGEVSDSVGMFEELPPELEDLRQQVVKNGYSVRFTDGVMRFRTKRGTATVDGVYANGEIVVNARSAKWATEQLVNHEMFHGFARENDGLVDAMVAKVFGDLTDAQIEEIVAKYQEAYKGAGLSRQQALEEICADAFAGMDRKNIGLAGRMSAAREFVGQQTGAQAATGMDIQGQTRAGRDNRTSTQTGKAAGSVAGGFVRGEAYSKVSIDGEFYEPSDAQLVRTHKTIHVVPAGNARYASGVRMSKEEYNRYRDEQSEKLRRIFGIYTNRDTAYSDTYGLIEAEIGTKTMRKARSTGGVALLDIMPKLGDIFENAVVLGTKADRANDTNLKGIVDLLGCADLGNGNIAIVKLNVKEYTNDEAKLYGSRIVEIEKLTVLAGVGHSSNGGSTSYAASFDPILRRYREAVNREAENSPMRSGKEKETSEPNFSIAGEQARTADRAALEDAREMEKQGMDAAEIFRETGWYMGRDGKWRFELDDSAMRYSRMGDAQFRRNHPEYAQYQGLLEKVFTGEELTAQEEGRLQSLDETWGREGGRLSERVARGNAYLEDILDHPVLFEAYPQLRETRIRFSELGDGENGNYDRKTNTITLSEKLRSAPEDTLVHEIQHAIQQAEGFAGGASPEYWASRKGFDNAPERAYLQKFKSLTHEQQNQWTRYQELDRVLGELFLQDGKEAEYDKYERQQDALYERLYPEQWFKDMLDAERNKNDTSGYYRELYMNTAGEIEARDVSRRRTWDAGRRRNTMPDLGGENTVFADGAVSLNADVPFAEQIKETLTGKLRAETTHLNMGQTPSLYGKFGLNTDIPVLITAKHIRNMNAKIKTGSENVHGLSRSKLSRLPQGLANPVMVMVSNTDSNRLVVVTDIIDSQNRPVIMALQPDGRGYYLNAEIDANVVLSGYGKDNIDRFLISAFSDGRMLYCDYKRSHQLQQTPGIQFPNTLPHGDFTDNIAQYASRVKGKRDAAANRNANETEAEEIPDGEEIAEGVYETSFSVAAAEDIQNRGKLFYAQSYAKVKASAENRALLNAAKAGNTRAAADFVDALIRDAYYRKVQENYTGATLAPLIGAAGSTNVLPEIFAERISEETGLPVLRELMKTSVNHMRNKSRANRQKQRLEFTFTGMPDYSFAGRHYVVVDDVVSTGTTMNALAEWIMERGGIVDGYLALAKGIQNVVSLEADAQALAGLTGRYGSDALLAAVRAYGLGERLEDLTRGEIRQLETHPELFGLAAGGGESDMRFSAAQEDAYTYDTLIGKPDMPVTVVDDTAKYSPDKATRKAVLDTAIKNAASVGHTNANGNAVVPVEDIGADVLVSRKSLTHGLDRRFSTGAPVLERIGEVLHNSICVNELIPRSQTVLDTYVLIGAAENKDGEKYIVSFVVNRHTRELETIDVLYAANIKKEPAALLPKITGRPATPTDSTLSIAELLEYVNRYFPDVLSMDVLAHFGHSSRPEGTLGESAMFSPAAGTDYDAQIREYDEKIESLELEAAGGDEAARGALIAARLNRSALMQQRAQVRQIKRDAGVQAEPGAESGRRVFRPAQTIRQTENRILDLFRIQAGSRAEMRGELHSILERILMDGYVGDSDVDRALRAMYEAGREVRPAADPVYEDIAKGLHGKKIYVSDEVRAEFGEDWNGVRQQLWGRGIYTSTDIHESGIDSVYAGLAGEYPGLFDGDNTDMRGMLEEILEAAQLGRAVHLTLGEAAEARGLTSGEEFEALTGEVMRELSKFADTAGVESRMRERTAQELERQREQYAEARRKAAERRAVAEQMRKIRSSLNRLNKRARVNDQILSRTMSMQDEATQEIMRQAQAQISTVANRITGKKMQNLLELKRVYEEAQAENPNFLPNPATEKALERVGQVHLQDLSVDELHTLYEAVERITHDLRTQDELIGKAWDDQLDHAADALEQEIEFSHGAKGEGKLAKLYNEESLSPSRALLRLVGYERSGIMGKIVKEFEDGDIAAMEYEVGADKIFADFMKKNGDWLKTAAGKKAKVVEVEVPRILAWGEGDAPIYDENGPKTVKIKLTQMMLVQMALDARNEDNLRHIQYGGYSLPDIDRLKAGKTGSAYAKGEHVRGVKLAPEVLRRIVEENLDAQGKEYALLLHRYYNQFSKDRINRTSRMLDGVDRAMTKEYYPMQSDQGYLPKQYNVFDGTLEGMGSLKERQSGARNAIILGEADATMRWHRDNMARYVGYAVAKRNFEKLLNYRTSRGITIRESIKEKWGVNADAFLSDFMRTVEEGSLENVPDILSSITGNYVGGVLGFNVASMMKQLGAIPMAATKLGTGAMAVGLFQKGKSRDFILKYTPYLESRGKGYTYTEVADAVRKHEGRPSNRFMQTITGQNWLTAMDTAVNKAMWGAAEWYVSRHTNLRPGRQEDIDAGTDLFYQKVAEVFNRATHDTQTNYNLMSRPFALQRKGLRPFVMFRTDAYQAVGMIREAIGAWDTQVKHLKAADGLATKESVNEAGKLAVRAVLGVVSSNVLSAGIDLVRALLRGNDEEYEDEEGKLDLFRMGKDVARNTLINLLGGVVFVDTIAEFVDSQLSGDYFFAPELMGVASAEDFAGSIAEFVKTVGKSIGDLNALAKADGDTGAYLERQAEELAGAARDIALAVSQIFGLSLKNMERAVTTGLGLIYPGAKVAYNAVFSDVAKADLAGLEGDALVQGMTEYMRDELLFADEKVRDELVRLYGIYGAQILPGANAPTTRKLDDETERDLTVAEMGEWDAEYLRTMQKQLPEMISSTYYKSLSDDEKKAVLTSLNRFVAGAARKRIGMEPDAWVANVLEAGENGAEISDTVVYHALANMLEADRDGEGKAIAGSVLKKKIDLLDGMALTDREREAILGAFEQSEGGKYALAVKNGLKWDEYAEMVTEGWGGAENYNKLIDDGVAHDTALDLLEIKAGLEPEEGKTSVTNAQIYEAIAAADMTEAERYDAIGAVLGLDSKGYDKMRVVQDTGLRAADYAALRGAEQEDQYLDAVELGMTANTAYAVVSAVAALPKLPEGERYTDAQRQAAACGACKSTAEQIDAYILYGNATYKTAEKAKLTVAAENYGVTPKMVLEFKELLARHDANGNGSYDKAEKKAALEASGFTREQKRALWQLHDPDSKSNPFGGAWDIRDAYEEAKEKEKAEKKN